MSLNAGSMRWGIILIVIGVIIILNAADVIPFWKVVGVLFGLLLVWWGYQSIRRGRRGESSKDHFTAFGDNIVADESPHFEYSSVFGDSRIRAAGKEFARGSVKAVFGDISVDLSGVERIVEPGLLLCDSVFGDIRVRLPAGLAYEIEGSSVFGTTTGPEGTRLHGGRHRSTDFDSAATRLRIHVSHVFGDNEIMR
jgi:predicted membrane protein